LKRLGTADRQTGGWEIISGHSAATVFDRYGGENPPVLLRANEDVCEFLTGDAELEAAILQLVS
jgi:hypothetical protein